MNMKHTPKTSLTAVLIYVAAILASIAVVSCRIHEYPVGPGVDPTMIVVNIDLTTDPGRLHVFYHGDLQKRFHG